VADWTVDDVTAHLTRQTAEAPDHFAGFDSVIQRLHRMKLNGSLRHGPSGVVVADPRMMAHVLH